MADLGEFGVAIWYGKQVKGDVDAKVVQQFQTLARELKPVIEDYTPVKTGKLKASYRLNVDADRKEIIVTNDQPYFIFIELGTSRMAARAPVRRGLAAFAGRVSDILAPVQGGTFRQIARRLTGGFRLPRRG